MLIVTVLPTEVRALRSEVLGWTTEAVPGDEDRGAVHLVQRDETWGVVAAVSHVIHGCPERPHDVALYLWGMAVRPRFQRQGLGAELLARVLFDAHVVGATVVWADARESAIPFYERFGAVVEGRRLRDGITALWDRRIIFDL